MHSQSLGYGFCCTKGTSALTGRTQVLSKVSTTAETLLYSSSARSFHGACNTSRFHTCLHPNVLNQQACALPRRPNKYIPALVSALTSLIFWLPLPTQRKQASASYRTQGLTSEMDLKDVH